MRVPPRSGSLRFASSALSLFLRPLEYDLSVALIDVLRVRLASGQVSMSLRFASTHSPVFDVERARRGHVDLQDDLLEERSVGLLKPAHTWEEVFHQDS